MGLSSCATTTVPPHQLYLLGDHRVVSVDSRQYGPVDDDTLHGRVLLRLPATSST